MTRLNKAKVEAAWLKILRLAKVDGLRRDAEVLAQSHEREVDRKDAMLQMLDRDLDEAEEQFQASVRDHLRSLDHLVELQDERLNDLERTFEVNLAAIEEEFAREREVLQSAHTEEVTLVRSTLSTIRDAEGDKLAALRQAHEQRREELRNASTSRIEELARVMDERIGELERGFETAHMEYLNATDALAERFKEMTAKDQRDLRSIRKNTARIQKLQSSLTATRAKMASAARDFGERNEALAREKAAMTDHVAGLKARIETARKAAASRLSGLSTAAKAARSALAEHTALAERVVRLNERCRSLETVDEKVAPFYVASDDHPILGATADDIAAGLVPARAEQVDADGSLRGTAMTPGVTGAPAGAAPAAAGGLASMVGPDWPTTAAEVLSSGQVESLDMFWRRYNKALAEKLALAAEKSRLEAENARLADLLRTTLEGISVTPTVTEGANPLLVINGRAGVTAMPAGTPASVKVDATSVVRHRALTKGGVAAVTGASSFGGSTSAHGASALRFG